MIEVSNMTKYYGNFLAVENVNFKIKKGEIVGFLGPNGAGKTTTMRVITGFIPPTTGSAKIAGFDAVSDSLEVRKRIGYLPETVPLYTDMTIKDYLQFMGSIRSMASNDIKNRIPEVVDICRLGDYRDTLIGKLSKGFRQRVGIAQAILHEPDVLVLDEPTIGIDPIQVVETRKLIKDLSGEHTLILSTHILPEVSMLCERVLIIHEGSIVAEDTPNNLSDRLQGVERVEMEIRGPIDTVTKAITNINGVIKCASDGEGNHARYNIQVERGLDLRERLAKTIVSNGWALLQLNLLSMTLEEIFLKLTTKEELDI